jgi:nucleotide-binding universal stress UspA family protein
MFKKILLATDGSADANQALAYTRDLALRDGSQVIVVHAFEPVPTFLGDPLEGQVLGRHVAAGEELAADVANHLREAGVQDLIVEVLEGPAARAILKVAEVRECDLIVMGSRGHGALASLILGSVSLRVVSNAQAPVLVAKAWKETES